MGQQIFCHSISSSRPPLPVLLPASTGQGLQISGQLLRRDGQIFYGLMFENRTQTVLDGFLIQFNKNSFGLAAGGPLQLGQVPPGGSTRTLLPMLPYQNISQGPPSTLLQVAVKNNQQPVMYFNAKISLHVFFSEDGKMERTSFLDTWKNIPDTNEVSKDIQSATIHNIESTIERLATSNIFFIAKRRITNKEILYLSCKGPKAVPFLIELTATVGVSGVKCAVKTPNPELAPLFFESIEALLN